MFAKSQADLGEDQSETLYPNNSPMWRITSKTSCKLQFTL